MKMRKLLAWFLAACMTLSLLPFATVPAAAADDEDADVDIELDDEGNVLPPDADGEIDTTVIVEIPDDFTFNAEATYPWLGQGSKASPFLIEDAEELLALAERVQSSKDIAKAHFRLTKDIDLSSVCGPDKGNWLPIGSSGHAFAGHFDGAGHTVSGLYCVGEGSGHGLFGLISGVVDRLTVDGTVSGSKFAAGIVALSAGMVSNCTFQGRVSGLDQDSYVIGGVIGVNAYIAANCRNDGVVSTGKQVGGVIGRCKGSSATFFCYNYGQVENATYAGGVVGLLLEGAGIVYCYNYGRVSNSVNDDYGAQAGGVVGVSYGKGSKIRLCKNYGKVSSAFAAGGIVSGLIQGTVVEQCENHGVVSGESCVGGICGGNSAWSEETMIVESCINYGSVSGNSDIGGIAGWLGGPIRGCVNRGAVTAEIGEAGGIVGAMCINHASVTGCCNTGSVTCKTGDDKNSYGHAGGIAGCAQKCGGIDHCFNAGTISCDLRTGGIVGGMLEATVSCCQNAGTIQKYDDAKFSFGGIAGQSEGSTVENCRNDGKVSGGYALGGIIGCVFGGTVRNTLSLGSPSKTCGQQHKDPVLQNNYTSRNSCSGLDTENVWINTPDGPRPRGVGVWTDNGVLHIRTLDNLTQFRDFVNAGVDYTDITVSLEKDLNISKETDWIPIGHSVRKGSIADPLAFFDDPAFSGVFDGNGHTISGLAATGLESTEQRNNVGLFGKVTGTVQNLQVSGSVNGAKNVGGIAGVLCGGKVIDCSFEGSVTGSSNVGGVVGLCEEWEDKEEKATVRTSFFEGDVTAADTSTASSSSGIGGVAGRITGGAKVMQCAVLGGTVTGVTQTGGIAGCIEDGWVMDCSHVGTVTGTKTSVGGVAGSVQGSSALTQSYHYTGDVSGLGFVGGVAGNAAGEDVQIAVCYYLSGTATVRGQPSAGLGIGPTGMDLENKAEALTKAQFSKQTSFKSWSFAVTWLMTETRPILKGLNGVVTFEAAGGTGTMDPYTLPAFGGKLPACTFTRDGYEFLGWSTGSAARGDWYDDEAVLNGRQKLTLYAVWGKRQNASYVDTTDGNSVKTENCYVLHTGMAKLREGWYCVDGSLSYNKRIEIEGSVNLILKDGAELTASNGIRVPENSTLTIWGQESMYPARDSVGGAGSQLITQTQGTGKLSAYIDDKDDAAKNAVIGGNYGEETGEIRINGGVIAATSKTTDSGAPIGGAREESGGNITINDGCVTAHSNGGAAGIGGGAGGSGGIIAIRGGYVNAVGGRTTIFDGSTMKMYSSSGIGAGAPTSVGAYPAGPTLTISSAYVRAAVEQSSAGGEGARPIGANRATAYNSSWMTISGVCFFADGNQLPLDRLDEALDSSRVLTTSPCADHVSRDGDINYCRYCGAAFGTIQGSGSIDDPFLITNSEQWDQLANSIAGGFDTNKLEFELTEPLYVTTRIGTQEYPFRGNMRCNGHVIVFACEGEPLDGDPFPYWTGNVWESNVVYATAAYGVVGDFNSSGVLTAIVTLPKSAAADMLLVAAAYDENGKQADVWIASVDAGKPTYHTGISRQKDCIYKLMLVRGSNYAPLCAAWSGRGQ